MFSVDQNSLIIHLPLGGAAARSGVEVHSVSGLTLNPGSEVNERGWNSIEERKERRGQRDSQSTDT